MKLFKKTIAILAIATLSLGMVACSSQKSGTESTAQKNDATIIAKVGDVPIYKTVLDNEMANMDYYMQMYYGTDYKSNADVMEQYYAYRDNVVQSLIEAEVLVLKAKEMDEIKVTDDEINEQLEVTKANFSTEDEFNTALEQSGMTLDEFKENIKKNLLVTKLIEVYANKAEVTDEEISEYYNTNIANYTKQAGANISHILVDSEEKANEVLEKYKSGTSFEDLAAEYGTDGTKDTGGSLGYIPYETTQYDADFMAGAKLLGEGEVSNPVKTQFGWHLIKADGIQSEDVVQPLDEVKDSIKTIIQNNKAEQELTDKLVEWKKEYDIQIFEENYKTEEATESESTEASASPEASTGTESTSPEPSTSTESASPEASASTAN